MKQKQKKHNQHGCDLMWQLSLDPLFVTLITHLIMCNAISFLQSFNVDGLTLTHIQNKSSKFELNIIRSTSPPILENYPIILPLLILHPTTTKTIKSMYQILINNHLLQR
jgi:hypothetical protein